MSPTAVDKKVPPHGWLAEELSRVLDHLRNEYLRSLPVDDSMSASSLKLEHVDIIV